MRQLVGRERVRPPSAPRRSPAPRSSRAQGSRQRGVSEVRVPAGQHPRHALRVLGAHRHRGPVHVPDHDAPAWPQHPVDLRSTAATSGTYSSTCTRQRGVELRVGHGQRGGVRLVEGHVGAPLAAARGHGEARGAAVHADHRSLGTRPRPAARPRRSRARSPRRGSARRARAPSASWTSARRRAHVALAVDLVELLHHLVVELQAVHGAQPSARPYWRS